MSEVDFGGVDLNLLKLFDALLKERSVTRAGQRLGLSQPAASRGLSRLRRLLNDPLFIRTSKGWELTPRAIALSEPVTKLLDDARTIVAPTAFDPSTASAKFSIATADHMALLLMPTLISRLANLAPGIDLVIPASSGDNVDLITQGSADIAIGVYDDLPARFHKRTLYEEDFVCVVRRDHPVIHSKLTLKNYISLSHLAVIITGQGNNSVDIALKQRGLTRRVAMKIPHFLVAPMIVAKSDLILSLPRKLAQQMAMSIPIEILELPLEVDHFSPSIIWHGRHHGDPAHAWLRRLIVEIGHEI
ncbi:LysR family transcriptional regulator [Enterovibrio calviensis]|uniref:LysR family transcriptional regulator n=1 Tax=Enterovibrio calviensis TaxID=91359 RepID=UPI003736F874